MNCYYSFSCHHVITPMVPQMYGWIIALNFNRSEICFSLCFICCHYVSQFTDVLKAWLNFCSNLWIFFSLLTISQMSPSYNDVSGKELLPRRQRRTHIPDKPNYSLNLWSIMKNCIGKELSKIPMPVSLKPGTHLHSSVFSYIFSK